MTAEKRKRSHDISTLLDFTDADLKANRHGALSRRQSIRVFLSFLGQPIGCLATLSFGGYLGFIAFFILLSGPSPLIANEASRGVAIVGSVILAVLSIVTIGIVGLFLRDTWALGVDLVRRRPHQVIGPLRKTMELGFMPCLVINEQTFVVKKAVYHSLMEGSVYHFYYTGSKQLLAVELIDENIETSHLEDNTAKSIDSTNDLTLQDQAEVQRRHSTTHESELVAYHSGEDL